MLASVKIGHWTGNGTGVTVLLPPAGTVASGEVRGGAPATREFALLDPSKMMDRVDAVVLSGGSAFGLAAAHGVVDLLHEREIGFPTPVGPVPIVVGMSLFDGALGHAAPGPEQGRAAALAAMEDEATPGPEQGRAAPRAAMEDEATPGPEQGRAAPLAAMEDKAAPGPEQGRAALEGEAASRGRVGAGTGATTGKWRMALYPGGFGWAQQEVGGATLAAVAAVNSWGDVVGADSAPLSTDPVGHMLNTTLVVLVTDARLSKMECHLLAQGGHDGFARAIDPVHTRFDGDAVVALATGTVGGDPDFDALRNAAPHVVSAAIRDAVSDS